MITSFFDGRVRIRHSGLKDPDTMALVVNLIRARDGIIDLVPNPVTGSLLVTYDPEKITRDDLTASASALENRLGPQKARDGARFLAPLAETVLLGGTFVLTALSGFVGKRAHIPLAAVLTLLTVGHVYLRRNCLRLPTGRECGPGTRDEL